MKKFLVLLLIAIIGFSSVFANGQKESEDFSSVVIEKDSNGKVVKPANYPKGVITWIVPSSAGGATDTFTRAMGNANLGGNVVVQNIGGGGQSIGTSQVYANPPNGQTLITASTTGLITMPLTSDVVYSADDFRYIGKIAPDSVGVAVAKPSSAFNDPEKMWNVMNGNKQYTVAVSSIGGHSHIELAHALIQINKLDIAKFVVYTGSNEVMQAIQSNEVDFGLLDDNYIVPYIEKGTLSGVITLHSDRTALLPNVKCLGEFGITGLEPLVGVKIVAVKADTPNNIVEWMKQQINEKALSPEYQQFLKTSGAGTIQRAYSEEELEQWIHDATKLWDEVLITAGIK